MIGGIGFILVQVDSLMWRIRDRSSQQSFYGIKEPIEVISTTSDTGVTTSSTKLTWDDVIVSGTGSNPSSITGTGRGLLKVDEILVQESGSNLLLNCPAGIMILERLPVTTVVYHR